MGVKEGARGPVPYRNSDDERTCPQRGRVTFWFILSKAPHKHRKSFQVLTQATQVACFLRKAKIRLSGFFLCAREDLNLQGNNSHMPLKHTRLPVSPLAHLFCGSYPKTHLSILVLTKFSTHKSKSSVSRALGEALSCLSERFEPLLPLLLLPQQPRTPFPGSQDR